MVRLMRPYRPIRSERVLHTLRRIVAVRCSSEWEEFRPRRSVVVNGAEGVGPQGKRREGGRDDEIETAYEA